MKAAAIQKDGQDYHNESFFNGQLPNRIFLGLILNTAYNGDMSKNPFKFDHHNCKFISLTVNGDQVPAMPLTPDFTEKHYTRTYLKMVEATGTINSPYGCNISYEDFIHGYCIFGFDLTKDLSRETVDRMNGKIQLDIKFSSILASQLTLIAYAEFDNNIFVNWDRHILTDFVQ